MRLAILTGFISLWIFSILAPAVFTIANKGEDTVMILCHNEEEKQESGEKDKFEEKIFPENNAKFETALLAETTSPFYNIISLNSCHIQEIHLPPPERIL